MLASIASGRYADKSGIALDAQKIRELREALGLTQDELARRAGLPSAQYLSDIERSVRSNLTIDTLERIAAALGVKAKDLLK